MVNNIPKANTKCHTNAKRDWEAERAELFGKQVDTQSRLAVSPAVA